LQKTLTEGAEFEIDDCVHPERWKGQHLTDLPPGFCNNSETTPNVETTSADPDDTEKILQSITFDATPFSDRINVTMQLNGNISTAINLTINYRQFGSGKTSELPIVGIFPGNNSQALVGLTASTGYQVCFQLAGRPRSQNRCLEITTLPEKMTSYPVTEVAVAASVSTSTTLVVVILVCCCCPSIKCGKKNKKGENNSPDSSSNKDEVDQKSKVLKFASSTNMDSESAGIWPNAEQFHSGLFSTFRGPGIAPVDDQSHQVFQATCNYLRQRALDPSRGLGNRGNGHLVEIPQHRRHSMTAQLPIYLTPITDNQLSQSAIEQTRFTPGNNVHYFNASYGLTEFHPGQSNSNPMGNQYKYCTWRPSKKTRHPPLLNSWTSYPDFLANSGSFKQHPHQPPVAVPVYSMTTSCRTRRNRDRFYWSAAPAPIHTVEMQF
jgi:hypothetical protein